MPYFDVDILLENVQDWFYTNCHRSCYEDDDSYISDIRYMIADDNDELVESCMDSLVDTYYMDAHEILAHKSEIKEFLIKESEEALRNFSYTCGDEDDE